MMFVIRRLQDLSRAKKVPLYMCSINLVKVYDWVDRTLLWAWFGVPDRMIAVIGAFHDRLMTYSRLDDGESLDWFGVRQGLH